MHKESRITCSSCEAEVKATDECVKNIQMFRNILTDLNLVSSKTTPIFNDNRRAVEWTLSFSTKGMRHLNIRENAVCEAQQLQEVSISHIPADIFTKEFKSNSTFRSLRDLLLSSSSFFPCSSLAWGGGVRTFGILKLQYLKFQNSKLSARSHSASHLFF
jgi:hypothetical protein